MCKNIEKIWKYDKIGKTRKNIRNKEKTNGQNNGKNRRSESRVIVHPCFSNSCLVGVNPIILHSFTMFYCFGNSQDVPVIQT